MQKLKKLFQDRQAMFACLGLILVALSLFVYSVELREPWFGVYSGEYHDWLTASTVIFSSDWFNEGALQMRFAMFENPKSPEFSNFLDRIPYVSYPPGAVIPVYLISIVTGHEPSAGMVMGYNLANHLLIVVFLALTVFFFLRSLKIHTGLAFSFALIPIVLELFLPYPFYFHQNVFFAQQAVILPFVIAIFLEVIRGGAEGKQKRIIDTLQGLVFFYGAFTEWLFVFVAAVFYAKRLFSGEIGIRDKKDFLFDSLKFLVWPIAGIVMFFVYLTVAMWEERAWAFSTFMTKFFIRSGTEATATSSFMDTLRTIRLHIVEGYGAQGKIIIYICILFIIFAAAYLVIRKLSKKNVSTEISRISQLAFIVFIPCIIHMMVFRQHAAIHSFSSLKLAVPIAIIPFVLIPFFLAVLYRDVVRSKTDINRVMLLLLFPSLIIAGFYVTVNHNNHKAFFAPKNDYWYRIADVVNKNIDSRDIVFSPDMEIPEHPPHLLSLTAKRVFALEEREYILDIIQHAESDFRVVVIFWEKPHVDSKWQALVEAADSSQEDGAFYLYFTPKKFQELIEDRELNLC